MVIRKKSKMPVIVKSKKIKRSTGIKRKLGQKSAMELNFNYDEELI